jgi:hypothetical protein
MIVSDHVIEHQETPPAGWLARWSANQGKWIWVLAGRLGRGDPGLYTKTGTAPSFAALQA